MEDPPLRSKCPSCQAELHPGAKFCHECGARAGDKRDETRRFWNYIAAVPLLIAAIAIGLVVAIISFTAEPEAPIRSSQSGVPASSQPSGQPVDLSTMTPREAADRLFNRVMAADENGDSAQAKQFAPMALEAYRLVGQLDADAHYHVGLINFVIGNLDEVRKQIGELNKASANHLLGLHLAFQVAKRAGDDRARSEILMRFAAAYHAEIGSGKPEYEAHRITIDKLHASTKDLKIAKASGPALNRRESGAQLFGEKCALCHGPKASGSDKGPPLVHKVYEPSHHADASFYEAVTRGVKSHHWTFGDMPAIPGVTNEQIAQIISYVRKLQVENGIR